MQLRCVKCSGGSVALNGNAWVCLNCAARFEIVRGVARFVDSQAYTGSFGFQWNHFAKSQLDSANGTTRSRDTFLEKTGFALEELRGKRILDAGCGMGRFAEIVAAAGAEVHAVDLSAAVDAAHDNLDGRGNINFYQADILNLPFAEGRSTTSTVLESCTIRRTRGGRFRDSRPCCGRAGGLPSGCLSTKLRL